MISLTAVNSIWNYLWKLMLLFVVFVFSAPFYWPLALVSGILLSIYALYLSWRTFKNKKYVGLVICILFGLFSIRFTFFPSTHTGFRYDENHQMVLTPHEHYLWEHDHVH